MPIITHRINYDQVVSKIEQKAQEKLKRAALVKVRKIAILAQNRMINFFDSHPITKELQQTNGGGKNISGVIGGNGNLFSYIGFPQGEDPTIHLKNVLMQPIKITYLGLLKRGKAAADFRFRLGVPSLAFRADNLIQKIERATPIPWSPSESWATGLRDGISGIGQYLYIEATSSRSGQGLQNIKYNGSKTFNNTDYLGQIFEAFLEGLRG